MTEKNTVMKHISLLIYSIVLFTISGCKNSTNNLKFNGDLTDTELKGFSNIPNERNIILDVSNNQFKICNERKKDNPITDESRKDTIVNIKWHIDLWYLQDKSLSICCTRN